MIGKRWCLDGCYYFACNHQTHLDASPMQIIYNLTHVGATKRLTAFRILLISNDKAIFIAIQVCFIRDFQTIKLFFLKPIRPLVIWSTAGQTRIISRGRLNKKVVTICTTYSSYNFFYSFRCGRTPLSDACLIP